MKAAGNVLPDGLRHHDLRSNAATALVAAGAAIKTAQTQLGHANPSMTRAIYARATAEADRRAADAVGEKFRRRDGSGRSEEQLTGKRPLTRINTKYPQRDSSPCCRLERADRPNLGEPF